MATRWFGGIAALCVVVLCLFWWLGWFGGEDELVAQTRAVMEKPREDQTKEEQQDLRDAWRERFSGLTDEQRQAMFETMMPVFIPMMMGQFEREYDKFMAMSPEEQQAKLDDRIDRMEQRGGPGGQGGPGGGGGGPRNMDPKRMAEFQKKWLAFTTPEQRAKLDNGIQIFNNRRQERGLAPIQIPGGGMF